MRSHEIVRRCVKARALGERANWDFHSRQRVGQFSLRAVCVSSSGQVRQHRGAESRIVVRRSVKRGPLHSTMDGIDIFPCDRSIRLKGMRYRNKEPAVFLNECDRSLIQLLKLQLDALVKLVAVSIANTFATEMRGEGVAHAGCGKHPADHRRGGLQISTDTVGVVALKEGPLASERYK